MEEEEKKMRGRGKGISAEGCRAVGCSDRIRSKNVMGNWSLGGEGDRWNNS